MANTKISELVQIIGEATSKIGEKSIVTEKFYKTQIEAAEAMNIVTTLLIEKGINPFVADLFEEFDAYVVEHGNKEIVPRSKFFDHLNSAADVRALEAAHPYLNVEIDVSLAEKDYHEVMFKGIPHRVLRENPFRG